MLKKARARAEAGSTAADGDFPHNLKETSRQIWLAGLGAFSRAQAEGTKMFETLVEQGQRLEARTRRAATETAQAAAGAAAQTAKEVQAMAGGTWDKLEQVFEDRVARALGKLGVYTQEDVARLAERVDALSDAVNALIKSRGGAATASVRPGAPRRKAVKAKAASGAQRTKTGAAARRRAAAPEAATKTATSARKSSRKRSA